jgi:hypothetical protein
MACNRAWPGASQKGIIWCMGSGSSIQIWRDPWIPRPPSWKISMKTGRTRLRWVSQLFVMSPPFKRIVSQNQDLYGVSLSK